MPWTVSDVDSHKKGLTPEQKKKWVKVANGVYDACISDGGNDSSCAPKAIRIANSKFSEDDMDKKIESLTLQKTALCFTDHDTFAKGNKIEEVEARKLDMVAYSGKIIPDHWYWGDLVIDTDGLKFSKKEIPILEDHNTDRKIGFGTFEVNDNHQIVPKTSNFLETPYAQEFIKNSDQGFPYEASIFARPSKIQRLMEKEEAEVNGFIMKGPGTIWRESVLKECSIVTFGADSNTKSVAMSENEEMAVEVLSNKNEKEVGMDLAKLKAEHPDLYQEVLALGKAEAETVFHSEKETLEAKITQLSADKDRLAADNKNFSDRLLSLEKGEALRKEQGIKMSADRVFSDEMKKTTIPQRLHSKIRKQLNHEAFVKDEKLDETSFAEAIQTELKDWVVSEDDGDSSVLGMSFVKDPGKDSSDELVARMLKHVGQAPDKSKMQ